MTRFSGQLVFLVLLSAGTTALAQGSANASLAQRLGSLREGWSFSSDKEPERPLTTPERIARAGKAESQRVAEVSDSPRSFPRVNPRELMPRNWFGVNTKLNTPKASTVTPPQAAASQGTAAGPSVVGSAQARLLRDMRQKSATPAVSTPRLAQRVQPRAGSALSSQAPAVNTLPPSTDSQLARSIAAEVADAMQDEEVTEPTGTQENDVAINPSEAAAAQEPSAGIDESEEPLFASRPAGKSLLPFGPIEGSTPTEAADPVGEDSETAGDTSYAEDESGRVSVAARASKPTKLPLFIGGRYSDSADETTIQPAETTPVVSPDAQAAFAETPAIVASAKPDSASDDLLLTQRMPVLVSRVKGPRTIVVGREANYRVLLANRGDVAADQVVTRVTIPAWAEVVSSKAADGGIDQSNDESEDGVILWRSDRLAAGEATSLDLKLIARRGEPISLGVTHSHRPVDGETLVEVQEPKLALTLVGPEEVLYGKPQLFRLTLSNPGTGTAERVKLMLTPPGGEADKQTSHDFGSIQAGDERSVEIELTAREAGDLAVIASAVAEGDVTAEVSKQVFCRKPELVVDWRGPADRYAGSPAVYFFRVRNPGTATAPNVVLNVQLPPEFIVAPGAEAPKVSDGKIVFRAGSLRPGDDQYFKLRGTMRRAGENKIALHASASDETRSEQVTAITQVVALADLKLDVLDPKGPIATGEEVEYEIRITNRGSNEARDIQAVGLFSAGVEPHHIEGSEAQMNDGRVAFESIDRLPAGQSVTFKIHARAHEEGTHRFRAEVVCRDLEIKLLAEETTRFFEDEAISVADGYPSDTANPLYPR